MEMDKILSPRLSILSGGPGAGKSTLIEYLQHLGHTCFKESGRAIIQQQLHTGGYALPWEDREAYAWLMFRQALTDHKAAMKQQGPIFFDRGLPDVIGYLELCGLPVPPEMEAAALHCRYHPVVSMLPPWPEIYKKDAERKQSFEEAVQTYEAMLRVYTRYGYEIIAVPRTSIKDRVTFLLDRINR